MNEKLIDCFFTCATFFHNGDLKSSLNSIDEALNFCDDEEFIFLLNKIKPFLESKIKSLNDINKNNDKINNAKEGETNNENNDKKVKKNQQDELYNIDPKGFTEFIK